MARLIDADALTKYIRNHDYQLVSRMGCVDKGMFTDGIEHGINIQPTVDAVEVVHGHWLMRGGRRYCSACGEMACVTRDRDDFWYTVGTKHCPNCGAKMDGDRNV